MFKSHYGHILEQVIFDRRSRYVQNKRLTLIRCFSCLTTDQLFCKSQTADMEILAAWYSEAKNSGRPVVIIVEHMERCSVTALAELIVLLRYCGGKFASVVFLETKVFTPLAFKKRNAGTS